MKRIFILLLFCIAATPQDSILRIEQLMTPQEMRDTGIMSLTDHQRTALNSWLNAYTLRVLSFAQSPRPSGCSPAIETRLDGEFEGWEGETIFKLANGQIWQQSSYAYTYHYAYRPEVTIYQSTGGCRLKVEDVDDTILVRRIK